MERAVRCGNNSCRGSELLSSRGLGFTPNFGLNQIARRLFAAAAAAGNRQQTLHFFQRGCSAMNALADLTLTDGSADTDVHSHSQQRMPSLDANANGCQLDRVAMTCLKPA